MNITHPFGISVFGSAIARVDPDIAMLRFTVSRVEKEPANAFQQTRIVVGKVQSYLAKVKSEDVGISRLTLSEVYEYIDRKNEFVGYKASADFNLLLRDLDQVETILVDLVAHGVNHIGGVTYQTSRLKEIRTQARQQAVQAAREKAEIYCGVAGVKLGRVLHIEDVNPDQLRGGEGHQAPREMSSDDGTVQAFNPASIVVGGAVMMAFAIEA